MMIVGVSLFLRMVQVLFPRAECTTRAPLAGFPSTGPMRSTASVAGRCSISQHDDLPPLPEFRLLLYRMPASGQESRSRREGCVTEKGRVLPVTRWGRMVGICRKRGIGGWGGVGGRRSAYPDSTSAGMLKFSPRSVGAAERVVGSTKATMDTERQPSIRPTNVGRVGEVMMD